MSALPENWIETEIGGLCSLKNGRAFKPNDWQTSGLPIVRIQNLNNPASAFNHFQGEVDERNRLRGGELLFAWSGTPGTSFGAHVWHGGEAVLNQHIFRVDFDESLLDNRFFRSAINQKLSELIDVAHGGVGLRHVTKGVFEKTLVALPPRPEQTRIANQLDTLLTRVQACNDRFDAMPALLKRFRQTVLDAAVSGALTYSWRVDRDAADWSATTVSSICQKRRVITYGVVKLGDVVPNGTPCLRTSNVRWLRFELDGMKRIAPSLSAEYSRTILRGGEVLVNVRGTLGGVAVAGNEMVGWNISREVAVLPVDQSIVNSHFAAYWVASDASQQWLAGMEKGIAYVGINIEDLRNLPIRLPSLPEQAEIVRRVEALFVLADRIEAHCTTARAQAQRLTPLVLAKAFRGELVPQDPNDEPARALLARIASSNTAVAGKNM
jgi:type I restriction enzyme S subunit